MKSIRGKFLLMNLISIFLCILLIGGLGLWSISSIQTASSRDILSLTCRAEGQDLDEEINSIQDSVELFCAMTDHLLPSLESLRDQAFVDSLYAETERNMGQIAKVTHGVCAYYFRTAPELTEKPEGFFYGKRPGTDSIEKEPLTDLSIYDPSDTEHVGWYYQPQTAGRAIWMEPYYNQNLDIYMVSYVVPFFRDGVFWAIAGMDIDFDVVIENVQSISPYKTGYAYLCSDQGKIYYHPSLEIGASMTAYCPDLQPVLELFSRESKSDVYPVFQYHFNGTGKTMAFHELDNGMKLILTVENSEIKAPLTDLFSRMACIAAILCAAAVLAVMMISNHISQPLKTLTQAAKQIASGNLDVELPRPSEDEVGILTRSFEVTVSNLKKYIASMNNMAFTDPLTQVKNKTAYDRATLDLQADMDAGKAKYGLIMLDLNRLKYINDRFGHDRGDEYIVACAKLICNVFKRSPVFRVGGDEFIVILVEESLEEWKALLDELNRRIESSYQAEEIWKQLSVAKGIAFCEPGDKVVDDVFVRADQAMYADKKKMKQEMRFPG